MINTILPLLFIFTIPVYVEAEPPDWYLNHRYRDFIPETHIIGAGAAATEEAAADIAFGNIARQIETEVESTTQYYIASFKEDDKEHIEESFASEIKSVANQQLKGAQIVKTALVDNKRYVLAALEKDHFLRELQDELNRMQAQIEKQRQNSDDLLDEGLVFSALETLMEMNDLYVELSTRAALYTAISGKSYFNAETQTANAVVSDIRKIIGRIEIEKTNGDDQLGKSGTLLSKPLAVRVVYDAPGKDEAGVPNIRLNLSDENDRIIERTHTDPNGAAQFWIYAYGTGKEKVYVNLDLKRTPSVFKDDLRDVRTIFRYKVSEVSPLKFRVEIRDGKMNRIEAVENAIIESITDVGHHVSSDAPFLFTGKIEPVRTETVNALQGKQYVAETELNMQMKIVKTGSIVGTMNITAKGMDESEAEAIKKSYRRLEIDSKKMTRLLKEAGDDFHNLNEELSAEALKIAQNYYMQEKYDLALHELAKVTEGENNIEKAKTLVEEIKALLKDNSQ